MTTESFSSRFKLAREHSGLNLTRISELIGVSVQAVWNYENRPKSKISVELLFPLADALKVDARWLATGDGAMSNSEAPSQEARLVEKLARSLIVLTSEKLQALSVLLGVRL